MNNREAGKYDSNLDNHPPYCTCVGCTKRRLGKAAYIFPSWLLAFLLVFSFSIIVFGLSTLTGSIIPFWLLLGLLIIYVVYASRRLILPLIILGIIILALASTVSMASPQSIVGFIPSTFEVLHILPTKVNTTNMEKAIFELVNQERTNKGLSSLLWDESLAQYARKHSSDMVAVRNLYHDKAELAKLQAGENALLISRFSGGFILLPYPIGLAFYKTDNELYKESVKSWVESPGHYSNMLTSRYKYTGVGIAVAEDGITCYVTQDFK